MELLIYYIKFFLNNSSLWREQAPSEDLRRTQYILTTRLAKRPSSTKLIWRPIPYLPEEQQQQRRPRKRKNADANRRHAPQIKRPRRAQQNIPDDEDEEEKGDVEGAIFSAAEQMQISRKTNTPIGKHNCFESA